MLLASRAFGIGRSEEDDWFDTIVDVDTELFIDPFLVFKDTSATWTGSHDVIIQHFNRAFLLVAQGNLEPRSPGYRKAVDALIFHEPSEFCLGYTSRGTAGAGSGIGFARLIASAIAEAIGRGLRHPRHFEELGILHEGIGADRISDATCTILKPQLIAYTQTIARRHGLPVAQHHLYGSVFDSERSRFRHDRVLVPTNPATGGPLLFVPKRFLAELPKLNADDWWKDFENERLRTDLDYELMGRVDKRTIVASARANPENVREWAQRKESESARPYDLGRDRKGVVQWEKSTWAFAAANPLAFPPPQTSAEFDSVIDKIIGKVKLFIEQQRGWYLLWDGSDEKPELAAQLVLYGIARSYCEANNVVIDPEVELGRGPVDFKFSNGYVHRAHLEVKKLHNGKFWNGLDEQLPSYMASDEVQKGWFVAVRYRSGRQWDRRTVELPGRVREAGRRHGRDLRGALIDARRPLSASRL